MSFTRCYTGEPHLGISCPVCSSKRAPSTHKDQMLVPSNHHLGLVPAVIEQCALLQIKQSQRLVHLTRCGFHAGWHLATHHCTISLKLTYVSAIQIGLTNSMCSSCLCSKTRQCQQNAVVERTCVKT